MRHTLFTEIVTWAIFLILTGILVGIGARLDSKPVSYALTIVWLALLVLVYRIRYKRL